MRTPPWQDLFAATLTELSQEGQEIRRNLLRKGLKNLLISYNSCSNDRQPQESYPAAIEWGTSDVMRRDPAAWPAPDLLSLL